jgi:hypothetical protein
MGRRRYWGAYISSVRRQLLLIPLLAAAIACKKKEEAPTCNEPSGINADHMSVVEPLPYLPAYPGSWWQYSDGSVITTGENYALGPILATQWDPNHGVKYCCIETIAYLPVYDGRPLHHYSRMKMDASNTRAEICCEQILSEDLGAIFRWGGSHYGRKLSKVVAVDTTVVLASGVSYSPCIVVARSLQFPYSLSALDKYYEVYARDVGLIKTWKRLGPDTLISELSSYYIAPH